MLDRITDFAIAAYVLAAGGAFLGYSATRWGEPALPVRYVYVAALAVCLIAASLGIVRRARSDRVSRR